MDAVQGHRARCKDDWKKYTSTKIDFILNSALSY